MSCLLFKSCGGEVITDSTTTATSCPYCDNSIVLTGQMKDSFRPDLVIPFQIDKNAAIEALSNHRSDKKFLPAAFKDRNHLEEVIGVYVPFWLYNCTANGDMSYRATRSTHWSDANNNYIRTHHYQLVRRGEADFVKIPADGSKKMADEMMEAIEPFDYSKAVEFKTPYLAG